MPLRLRFRWLVFVVYVAFFFVAPLTILFQLAGLIVGVLLALGFLVALRVRGVAPILKRMGAVSQTAAQSTEAQAIVRELARRLSIPPPRVALLDSGVPNVACCGFSKKDSHLILTTGAIDRLKREELSALIGRECCGIATGEIFCKTWLATFLAFFDRWVSGKTSRTVPGGYPFRVFLRQLLIYPLTLLPVRLLSGVKTSTELDLLSVGVTQLPRGLTEGLRTVEAVSARHALGVPFSLRHLFCVPPASTDPVAKVIFSTDELRRRIELVETKTQAVAVP
jgi:hypothetical protein